MNSLNFRYSSVLVIRFTRNNVHGKHIHSYSRLHYAICPKHAYI